MKAGNPSQGFDWRLMLQALASALPTLAASNANQDAQGDLLRGNMELAETQRRADTMIGDEIAALGKSSPEADEARTLADYAGAVQRVRATPSDAPSPTLGGERFKAETKTADMAGQQQARQTAKFAAGVDAPTRQREREGRRANRVAGDVRALGQEAGTSAFLARLRAQRRQPSPWATLLSQLGTSIARNYEGGGSTLNPDTIVDYTPPTGNVRNV